ncbi:IPT/TIG domain-containing protein [Deinococcus peraridilitoris]|uniref:IPT/TIG domain-containing protein n=1 Tax=Deinococcus peraridilitoris (strain DSM 19664 / LMG 22246 / CIP 109416 / KR-200) TaxID=937777 RepID=L0A745_DEIPD|nr:IPT/TIG domain-containing protein [Deinococcus peraridilitoris]AFZ69631.1 hypothetical protein Deipe_4288 [Deinococcus peraridilitoris DSM 19664]
MKPSLLRPTSTALLGASLLVACGAPGAVGPAVTTLSRTVAMPGDTVTLTGVNLGTNGTVLLGGTTASVTSYTNTSVTFTVPQNARWAHNDLQLITNGKSITAPMKLFVGQAINPSATTTTDVQTALNALPAGAALLLGPKAYTATSAPLYLNNRSLYGQGQDQTSVNGDVYLHATERNVVTVGSLTLTGDNYYLVNAVKDSPASLSALSTQLSRERQNRFERRRNPRFTLPAPSTVQSLAPEGHDVGASRDQSRRVRPHARAADVTAHRIRRAPVVNAAALNQNGPSGFHFLDVSIKEMNARRGYLENNASLSSVTVTDSTIELNDYISLGESGNDLTVKNSTLKSQGGPASGVDLEAGSGNVTIHGSAIYSSMWLNAYSESGNVTIQDSALHNSAANSVTCQTTPACYSLTDVGSNTGQVTITGSKVNATDGDSNDGKPTNAFVFIGSIRNLTTIENNGLIHSTANLQLYSDSSKTETSSAQRGNDQLVVRNNQEISAGDGAASPASLPAYLGIYSHTGDVTVSGNAKLTSSNGMQVYTKFGHVRINGNPDVRVDSASAETDAGFLHVFTSGNTRGVFNDVTFSGNTVKADDQVILDADNGNVTLSANAVSVIGNSHPKLQVYCREARTCTVTDNTLTANATNASTTSRIDLFFDHYSTTAARQNHTVTGNSFLTLGSGSSYFYGAFGWGDATLGANTFRSSGKVYVDAYQATVTATDNTFNVFDGMTGPSGSGLSLAAYKGTDAAPSVINFGANTLTNVGSGGVSKHKADGGRNDRVNVGANTGMQ